jgi:hypothetical protein
VWPSPVFASFTLAFALQLRKKDGKTSVGVRKTSVRLRKTSFKVHYTYYQNTHTNTYIVKKISWRNRLLICGMASRGFNVGSKAGVFYIYSIETGNFLTNLITANFSTYTLFQAQGSGFGGLEIACWPLVPKFAGSHPAKAFGFLG